jgi:hypothetical protein
MHSTRRAGMLNPAAVIVAILLALALPVVASAQSDEGGTQYVIVFEPTAMLSANPPAPWVAPDGTTWEWPLDWPPNGTEPAVNGMGASASMVIWTGNGQTDVSFVVHGARPMTLYTIWTALKPIVWCTDPADLAAGCPLSFLWPVTANFSSPWQTKPWFGPLPPDALPFYPEAGIVTPTASIRKAFTNGMGIDPGLAFYTDAQGNGAIRVTLDYNLLGTTYDDGPGVGISTTAAQCVMPGPPVGPTQQTAANCQPVQVTINGKSFSTVPKFTVASSWLRKFIAQVKDPATECANYDPSDPTSMFWQCIDPATADPRTGTGLPRVWRYPFDHFRLASHPDQLTHGFIGGSAWEHTIDLVGRRCRIQPPIPGEPRCD